MLQKLIEVFGREDYYFVVDPKNPYNTTGKYELHNIDSVEALTVGFWHVLRVLLEDKANILLGR